MPATSSKSYIFEYVYLAAPIMNVFDQNRCEALVSVVVSFGKFLQIGNVYTTDTLTNTIQI